MAEKDLFGSLLRSGFRLSLPPEKRRKNGDGLFALADVPSELVPGVESGDVRRSGFLQDDEQDIVQRIFVEAADGREVQRQRFTVPGLKRTGQLEADSLKQIRSWPDDVKQDIGGDLRRLEDREHPLDSKPMGKVFAWC